MLDATIALRVGDTFALDVALDAAAGETLVLLGPNGAGKTTILRVLAGLAPIDEGAVRLDGSSLDDPFAGVFVPPEQRPVGVVFQDHLLFPHLSALENVAFGLRARGMPKRAARAEAASWLERLGLAGLASHRPSELSGGQAQQVALARALALRPRLLLLDEPLAALDVSTRVEVRRELRRQLGAFDGVRVLVTHDPVEAVALADRVAVIEEGRVRQAGTIAELRARPRSRYVADVAGVNLYEGVARGDELQIDTGEQLAVSNDEAIEGRAFAIVHPEAVAVYRDRPVGSPRNTWTGVLGEVDDVGRRVRVRVDAAIPITAEITPRSLSELGLRVGSEVWVSVKATEIEVYAA